MIDEYHSADLTKEFPRAAVSDSIIHLAGLAAVGPSFDEPQTYLNTNSSMVTNMCEAILAVDRSQNTRLLAISTGAVYAPSGEGELITESHRLKMSSPYVVSKVLVENLLSYYSSRGIASVVARPFNHIGPGQGPGFIVPDLWKKLTTLGNSEPLQVGNLDTERDYLDVRDVASAYIDLVTADSFVENTFNICSGNSVSGLSILEMICAQLGIDVPELEVNQSSLRPNDAMRVRGSAEKLKAATGWQPEYSIEQSIRDFVVTAANITD